MRTLVAALGLVLVLVVACGQESPPSPLLPPPVARYPQAVSSFEIAEFLPVATQRQLGPGPRRGRPFRVDSDGALRQRGNSSLTLHFALPPDAVWRGRATLDASRLPQEGDVLHAVIVDRALEEESFSFPLGDGRSDARLDFQLPLAAAGGMARLHLELRLADPSSDLSLVWSTLRIEAPSAPPPPAPELPRRRYNVLLVLFDTLRADRTEPYGPERTPHLAALARRGVVFEHAFSTAPWTSPSVASMLTGVHATVHRVRGPPWSSDPKAPLLPSNLPYLPEILARHDYATVAVINNPMISPNYRYDRGFDRAVPYYEQREAVEASLRTPEAQADRVWDEFVAPTLEEAGSRPFFAYVHEIDPHNPYDPPEPYRSRHVSDYDGPIDRVTIHDIGRLNAGAPVSPADQRHIEALYQGEISFMDAYLGRLLERLERSGRAEDTLVVFTSDHGEGFGEHGLYGHGGTLHEEMVRIPLLMALPGVLPEGRRVAAPIQLLDLMPTLLDLLGIDVPEGVQGYSLLSSLADAASAPSPRPLLFRAFFLDRFSADAVRYGDWKLQRRNADVDGSTRAASWELYHLGSDPQELKNRWNREPIVGHALRQMLQWQHHLDGQIEVTVEDVEAPKAPDPEILEQLRQLGYVD